MNPTEKPKRGGARPGAGRPHEGPKKDIRIWLDEDDHASIQALGGTKWLKDVALKALKRRKAPTPQA